MLNANMIFFLWGKS